MKIFFIRYYILAAVLAVVSLPGCAGIGVVRPVKSIKGVAEKKILDTLSQKAFFDEGKRFVYTIAWNHIPVGRITAEIGCRMRYRSYNVFPVKLVTESNNFLSKIYRVEDTYISYVDADTFTSRRYEANRKEGRYRKHVIVEYDFNGLKGIYTNLTDGSVKTCAIEKKVQDPLSAVCYFMALPVIPGDKVPVTVNLNEKNYDVYGIVNKVEAVRLKHFGALPAFKVIPHAELDKKRVRKGKAWLYFSADRKRYPLYGGVKIPFGTVTATLVRIEDVPETRSGTGG